MQNLRILLVEDNISNQQLFKSFLLYLIDPINEDNIESLLYIATTSKDAIEMINTIDFNYISLDGELDYNSSGLEVLDYLVSNNKEEILEKVIFSSAKPLMNEDVAEKYGVKTVEKTVKEIKKYIKEIGNGLC